MNPAGRRRGALTEAVVERGLSSPFFLLDVGCSGGIDRRWRAFGHRLRAIGFDPLVAEIERLSQDNAHPEVRYEAGFVTCRGYEELFPARLRDDRVASKNNDPFQRTSAVAAMERMPMPYIQTFFNSGAPVVWSERRIVLDEVFVQPGERARVDFVKIDTDGHDIAVILGAEGIMQAGGILGLNVEVQLHGAVQEFANTFANIDRVLRGQGFSLFDLPLNRYSRAALPAPFVLDRVGPTTSGQHLWGKAFYCRDLAAPDYERMWAYEVTSERVMKLACLFDLFDLPDCAAELLVHRGQFLDRTTLAAWLDRLVAPDTPGAYADHMAAFGADFTSLYRSRTQTEAGSGKFGSQNGAAAVQRLQARVAELVRKNAELRDRLTERRRHVERLTRRIEELQSAPETDRQPPR